MFLYSVAIRLYVLLVYLASPFHQKARKLIMGRAGFFKKNPVQPEHTYIWFHCASLGEFEQGRPLIEKIKSQHPEKKILLSFFSSSGYEIRKNYEYADQVIYLPFDLGTNANRFFGTFNISAAVFVKYDVWPGYLNELVNRKIPTFLISATFRKDHFYFKWYGKFITNLLKKIDHIFVQDKSSLDILLQHGFTNVNECGDLRVDRVMEIHSINQKIDELETFLGGDRCFIFGSVYPLEIELIKRVADNSEFKIIIAPHHVDTHTIGQFKHHFTDHILLTEFNHYSGQRFLIVNNIGMLNKIYKYGNAAYVGGGFGKGIHNILEPAVWGIPVYIGPKCHKFPEADSLEEAGLVFIGKNVDDLAKLMRISSKEIDSNQFRGLSKKWFQSHSGANYLIYSMLGRII